MSKQLVDVLKSAHAHKGTAFVEIFQNCIVYNADVFAGFTEKANQNHQLWLENGKPMLFAGGTKGITMDMKSLSLQVVDVVDGNWEAAGVLVHDVTNRTVAHMLVEMPFGPFPMALGVIYDDPRPTYEDAVLGQDAKMREGKSTDLGKLLAKGQTWTVNPEEGHPA